MGIFGPIPWVKPFGKMQFFDFLNFLFLQPRKAFFALEYRKRHFPGLYCLKKKMEKMSIFRRIPFKKFYGKMSIFRVFELPVFIASKGVFWFQNIVKEIFSAHIELKISWKNSHFQTKAMENVNISTFCSSFFYSVERRFFVLEYRKGHFPMLYCGKKKLEKGPFLDQNHGLIR